MLISSENIVVILSVLIPNLILIISVYVYSKSVLVNLDADAQKFYAGMSLGFIALFTFPFFLFGKFREAIVSVFAVSILLFLYRIFTNRFNLTKLKFDYKLILFWGIIGLYIIYVYFYDALRSVTPSYIDTLNNHIHIIDHLNHPGTISYFPSITQISTISYLIADPSQSLNYLGASLGIVVLISINLILSNFLSNSSLIIFNLIMISPFYYPSLFQRMGLNNGMLTPLFYFALLTILIRHDKYLKLNRINVILITTILVAFILTAPHILLLITPPFAISLFLLRRSIPKGMTYLICFIFVFLLAVVINYNFQNGNYFANIVDITNFGVGDILKVINEYTMIKSPIRPFMENYLSVGAYIFLAIFLLNFVFALKVESLRFQIISIFGIMHSITTITGILEFTAFKGRSGFYLMYCVAIYICLIYESIHSKIRISLNPSYTKSVILGISILCIISLGIATPNPYRLQNESGLVYFKKYVTGKEHAEFTVTTNFTGVNYIEKEIITKPVNLRNLKTSDYILLNTNNDIPDSRFSNLVTHGDGKYQEFIDQLRNDTYSKNIWNQIILQEVLVLGSHELIADQTDFILIKKKV